MIKTLAKRIGGFKRATILTPICMVGEVFMEVIIPWLMALLIDNGVNGNDGKGDFNYILITGGLLVVCCVLSLLSGFGGGKFGAIASTGFARNLRRDMFHKVQEYSFANIDKFSTASLVTRLTSDVTRVQDAFQMLIRIAVRAPMTLLFSLFASFAINAELSIIFVAAIPILGVGLFLIMSKAHPVFERVFKRYDNLNSVVQENVSGMRVVKAFVREDHEIEKFKNVSKSIYDDFSFAEKVLAFNGPLMQFCVYAGMLLVAWLGANLIVVDGTLKTGELMSVITYAMQVLMSLMMLSMIFVMLTMARASAERICEVLNEESTLQNRADPLTEVPNGSIRFHNVSFAYREGGEFSLSNIDLDIRSGETVGIIGGTGSSKSTLVQLIPRLYDVTEGSVEVGGRDVREYNLETLRNEVAMVLQKNVLFSGTIKENLRWGNPDATDEEIVHACRLAQADSFIESFPDRYDTYIEQGGTNVSGGQKQRLCIARALLKKPKILILDDSTSAVDTATDALIRKAFREEIPDTTKLIIAQRISSVQDADKIIVLDGGKVHGFGTHEELLSSNDIYREVYYSQQKGGEKHAETE